MEKLEEQAIAIAEEAAKDAPSSIIASKSVLFVRGETSDEYEQSKNPDEIDIAEASSDDDGDEGKLTTKLYSSFLFSRSFYFFVSCYFLF